MVKRVALRVDALPGDVFELLTSFLTGFDLLRLSHVNGRLLTELLARDSPKWKRRARCEITDSGDIKSSKERYCRARSVRFRGRTVADQSGHNRGGAVDLWDNGVPRYWLTGSFSFDLWFALQPADSNSTPAVYFGGIILGAQSSAWYLKREWPHYHQQFVHIDPQGGLYCSVLNSKTLVARNLQPERWYHLALTFDQRSSTQCVYLNGELVHETSGHLHRETYHLYSAQLGSGCISGGAQGVPTKGFCGWYSFNGVLDSFRLWCGVLQPDQVRDAARCERLSDPPKHQWSMATSTGALHGDACRVRCTRPAERVCAALQQVLDRPGVPEASRGHNDQEVPVLHVGLIGRRIATASGRFTRRFR